MAFLLKPGTDVASPLRERRPGLPWLLYTGFADSDTVAEAQRLGAQAVLMKPVEREQLRAALKSALAVQYRLPKTDGNAQAFEKAALAEGFDEVVERRWKPNEVLDWHHHPFDVKGLMVAGELWLTRGDTTEHLREGDIFEVPLGELHAERYGRQGATFWVARRYAR